jgi:hypothetical protein
LNVSAWGIALEMAAPAERGAQLRIEFPECVASGAVAYCRPVAGSYFVGVKLDFALDSIVRLASILDEITSPFSIGKAGDAAKDRDHKDREQSGYQQDSGAVHVVAALQPRM